MRVTLIDNYDSFTFNLVHYLGELGADVSVWRNDELSAQDALTAKPDAIVLSPGPCTPNEAGMHLLRMPKRPNSAPAIRITVGLRNAPESWRDYLYWNVELDDT